MKTAFALASIAAAAAAQGCCPTQCSGSFTRSCCTTCPNKCGTTPPQMDVPVVNTAQCEFAQISWNTPRSCSPLTFIELECQTKTGLFSAVPSVNTNQLTNILSLDVIINDLKLDSGDDLICRVRARNTNGGGAWSYPSMGGRVGNCVKELGCQPSCFATGCNGRCVNNADQYNPDLDNGSFDWADSVKTLGRSACCSLPVGLRGGRCGCEKPVHPVRKLCKRTYFTELTTPKTQIQLSTEQKTVTKTRWGSKTVMMKRSVPRSRTVMVKDQRPVHSWKTVENVRNINKERMTRVPIPAAPVDNCSCFKQDCGCAGQVGCGCCQPACDCAPELVWTTKIETYQVPEHYQAQIPTITMEEYERPVVESYFIDIQEPVEVAVPETYQEIIDVAVPMETRTDVTTQVPHVRYELCEDELAWLNTPLCPCFGEPTCACGDGKP